MVIEEGVERECLKRVLKEGALRASLKRGSKRVIIEGV